MANTHGLDLIMGKRVTGVSGSKPAIPGPGFETASVPFGPGGVEHGGKDHNAVITHLRDNGYSNLEHHTGDPQRDSEAYHQRQNEGSRSVSDQAYRGPGDGEFRPHTHPETTDSRDPMESWDVHTNPSHCDATGCTYPDMVRSYQKEDEARGAQYLKAMGHDQASAIADARSERHRSARLNDGTIYGYNPTPYY